MDTINLSYAEIDKIFLKHLTDHVENIKTHRFEFAGYEEDDIEEDAMYLVEAMALRDFMRNKLAEEGLDIDEPAA